MAPVIPFPDKASANIHGEYRLIERDDSCYVVGHGFCLAVINRGEGERLIADLDAGRVAPHDV